MPQQSFGEAELYLNELKRKAKQRKDELRSMIDQQANVEAAARQSQVAQQRAQVDGEHAKAELQIKNKIAEVKAKAMAQKKAEAGAAAQQQQADDQRDAPILGEPQSIDGTRPDLATMQGIGPRELSNVPPLGGGNAANAAQLGPLAPYITTQQATSSVQQRPMGGVPVTTTQTTQIPNVVTANQAARIRYAGAEADTTRRMSYYDDLAGAVSFLGPDDPLVRDELAGLNAEDQIFLRRAMNKVGGAYQKGSLENPLEVLKNGDFVRVPRAEALGMPTGALQKRAAGAARINVGPFDLTPQTKTTVQEQMLGSLAAVQQLSSIEEVFDPKAFTTIEQARQWVINKGARLGFPQSELTKAASANFTELMALNSAYSAEEMHRVAGSALTPLEMQMNAPRIPDPKDPPQVALTKVKTAKRMATMAFVRNKRLLAFGFNGSMEDALAAHPEYLFSGGTETQPSPAEARISSELQQEQQRIADRLKALNPNKTDRELTRESAEELYRSYGIPGGAQ